MTSRRKNLGLSLVELMIALLIGTILLIGVVQVFGASRTAYQLSEGMSRTQENARFALDYLQRDIRMAGHFGCVNDQARGQIPGGLISHFAANGPTDFEYSVRVAPRGDGVAIQVLLDRPLPQALAGKAGFNLEFLPSAYFGRAWLAMRKSAYERVSPHSHGRIASWASSIAALSAKRRRPSATLVASTGPSR